MIWITFVNEMKENLYETAERLIQKIIMMNKKVRIISIIIITSYALQNFFGSLKISQFMGTIMPEEIEITIVIAFLWY